ncbi:MAG: hypothetical protein LBV78_04045, partial [Kitasatospora sp.]|nr:hypothetical protein [Kitasatospora sp.]
MELEESRLVRIQPGEIGRASHEQLVAMIENANPFAVSGVGQQLIDAAQQMDQISEELHTHISSLDWEGQAADSFKNWGTQVSRSTMDLATYSRNAGTHMTSAGDTLSTVKYGLPPVPYDDMETVRRYEAQDNTAATVGGAIIGGVVMPGIGAAAGGYLGGKVAGMFDPNWVTEDQARAASDRVFQAHQEAITQMERLSQSYEYASTQLNSAAVPTFPAPPGYDRERDSLQEVPIGGGNGRGGGGGSTTPPQLPTWTPPGGGGGGGTTTPPPTVVPPPPGPPHLIRHPGPVPTPHPYPTPTPPPPVTPPGTTTPVVPD